MTDDEVAEVVHESDRRAFAIILKPDPTGGFVATCPSVPEAISQGETVAEAVANIQEAVDGCLHVRDDQSFRERIDRIISERMNRPPSEQAELRTSLEAFVQKYGGGDRKSSAWEVR